MSGYGVSLALDAGATNDEGCPHSSHSSLRSRLFLSGGLRIFGDAATADGFTFSHCATHSADHMLPLVSEPPVN